MPRHLLWIPLLIIGGVLAACCGQGVCCPDPTVTVSVSGSPDAEVAAPVTEVVSVATEADPFLWMVDAEPRVFLFGTIHIADAEVKEQSDVEKLAFDQCDTVFTEILMDDQTQFRAAAAIQEHGLLPADTSLDDLVDADRLAEGDAMLAHIGPNVAQAMHRMKPAIFQLMILQVQMLKHAAEAGSEGPVLDMKVVEDAKAAGKTTLALEDAADQVKALVSLTIEEQVQMLERTIEQFVEAEATGEDFLAGLIEAYQAGDPDQLMNLPEDDELTAKFMRAINDERNAGMTAGIVAWMKANPEGCAWVAVGALHMPGENGIVERLRREGYDVVRVRLRDARLVAPRAAAGAK